MNAYPFSIFKRADRSCFSVSFKDSNGKYLRPVSTGKKTENEAVQVAFQMLRDGIPLNEKAVTVQDLAFKDMVRKIKTENEAEAILAELRRLGWVKGFVVRDTKAAEDFISFLINFWNWDTSPYIQEKLRKAHGIHRRHCKMQSQAVKLYWTPFFNGRAIGDITAKDIDAFITDMGKKDVSASRKNVVILAGIKPLRWAFSKGIIETDPTRGHIMYSGEKDKPNILTPSAAGAIFRTEWKDERAKLANMLASVTGMRMGEILGLQFQDLGQDCIYVRNSFNDTDGLKTTKTNEERKVETPFPGLMFALFSLAQQNPWGCKPTSFVFWAVTSDMIPMQGSRLFLGGLREALENVGFTKEEAVKYKFHGLRHFFTSNTEVVFQQCSCIRAGYRARYG